MTKERKLNKIYLLPYINEILTNAKWTISLIEEGQKYSSKSFEKVKYYSLAISTASNILQFAYLVVSNREPEKSYAKTRVRKINKLYPELPKPPIELRKIRNTIQHFDERIDKEIFQLVNNEEEGYVIIEDHDGNIESYNLFSENQFERRIVKNNVFQYWDHVIKINELLEWCKDLVEYIENITS